MHAVSGAISSAIEQEENMADNRKKVHSAIRVPAPDDERMPSLDDAFNMLGCTTEHEMQKLLFVLHDYKRVFDSEVVTREMSA